MCKYFSWKNTKGKKKTQNSKRKSKRECCCNVLGGPKENRVKFYQENYRVKITNSIKRGRRGKSRVNLVLGVRNSALGTADLPWLSLGADARHRSPHGKIQKGPQDGIPKVVISAEMAELRFLQSSVRPCCACFVSAAPFGRCSAPPAWHTAVLVQSSAYISHIPFTSAHELPWHWNTPCSSLSSCSSWVCTHSNRFPNHRGHSVLVLLFVIKMTQKKK